MNWSASDLLIALKAAGEQGLTHEECEAVLGVPESVSTPQARVLVRDALWLLRMDGHLIADDDGVSVLVHERSTG